MNKASRVVYYLEHIIIAIERIQRYVAELDEFDFKQSELLQDAVVRNIEVIGEAANNIQKVDPGFAASNADIPWQVMYAMRNRLSHGYDKIDFEMVWRTVRNDLPTLHAQIKSALTSHNGP